MPLSIRDLEGVESELFKEFASLTSRIKLLNEEFLKLEELVNNTPDKLEVLEGARNFLQVISEETRNRVTSGLESVVTMCIQAVFGYDYSFRISPDTKRNATVIDFLIVDNSGDEEILLPPETNFGGGMIDTISIGLRFGLLKVLAIPPKTPMILDEPAKMVSEDRIQSIASLINELARTFDKQVIMVTHRDGLMELADNSIVVRKEKGTSIIE